MRIKRETRSLESLAKQRGHIWKNEKKSKPKESGKKGEGMEEVAKNLKGDWEKKGRR